MFTENNKTDSLAATGNGYPLSNETSIGVTEYIRSTLPRVEFFDKLAIIHYKSTDSTNTQAKLYVRDGRGAPALFIADEQTHGRGRLGRRFISENERGLYMSLLFSPSGALDDTVRVTSYASVIVCRAIEELCDVPVSIKWVNDIYVNKRKLAGILCEGHFDPSSGGLHSVIVGIGINITGKDFPSEIENIATSLECEGAQIDKYILCSKITELFYKNIDQIGSKQIADEYRSRSILIGKQVSVNKPLTSYNATVEGINDLCELCLLLEDGTRECLATGEVSVREQQQNNN